MISLGPIFNGLRLIITKHGDMELFNLGLTGWEIVEVLTNGWDCSRSKRREGTIERCLESGNKVIRAVAIKEPYDLEGEIEEAYYLIHVSIEARKKDRIVREGE
jgi:hypothetical protein